MYFNVCVNVFSVLGKAPEPTTPEVQGALDALTPVAQLLSQWPWA